MPDKKKVSFRETGRKFIYIGRLDAYHKGLDLMLDATVLASETLRKNGAKIYIYGPDFGGKYADIESMITERDISDIVVLNHEVSGIEKENALLDADIFIQTSRFEGMPMGILEAMSYGLPCLVTEGTTLGGVIGDNGCGWRCDTNAISISEYIKDAIMKDCTDFSMNAIKTVGELFSWNNVTKNTMREYSNICKRV